MLFRSNYDDPSFFPFLNSGTILGTASALNEMALEVSSYPSIFGSDQRGYARYYLTHRERVGMDVQGRTFLTLYGVVQPCQIDLISRLLRSDVHLTLEAEAEEAPGPEVLAAAAAETATDGKIRPAVIHGNGGRRLGKEYYDRIVATSEQV